MLAFKIVSWYLVLGGLFIFTMIDKIDLIVVALRMRYENDDKKQLSETGWRKFILVLFLLLWPIFVISILRKFRRED